jgi:hypothetical protein
MQYVSSSELAARYHGIHQALAGYREQYVAIHRRVHGTAGSAAFQTRAAPPLRVGAPLPKLSGPSPFSAPRYGRNSVRIICLYQSSENSLFFASIGDLKLKNNSFSDKYRING